jgi:hypothetical protein
VPLQTPIHCQRELSICRSPLPTSDVTQWAGMPVTTPARTGFDLGRRLPRIDAIAALDALLGTRFLNMRELQQFTSGRRRWRARVSSRCSSR